MRTRYVRGLMPPAASAEHVLSLIESFDQLDLLLLLAAHDGSIGLDELATRRGLAEDPAVTALELVQLGLAVRDGAGRVSLAQDPGMSAAVGALRRSYLEDPLPVVQLLSRKAIDRVRSAAVKTFADSFVVRRKDG